MYTANYKILLRVREDLKTGKISSVHGLEDIILKMSALYKLPQNLKIY
jgi:hypothetical protein